MYECQFCGKVCKNQNSLRNHERMCPSNPDDTYRTRFTNRGKPGWNKGLTKETNASVARYAKSLIKDKPYWQLKVDDDGKLYQRYLNKKTNAKAEGLDCELTFEEYCYLVESANLVSSQLGFTGEGYVLARYHDVGNYSINNCRFIKQLDNAREKVVTEKARQSSRRNAIRMNQIIHSSK